MRLVRRQTNRPKGKYSTLLHILLTAALPAIFYVLVRLDFEWIAVVILLMSKWRMLAVKARHWTANIRANAVDIFVGLSIIILMASTSQQMYQLVWGVLYAGWLLFVKPRSTPLWVGTQAIIAQTISLAAGFYFWSESSTTALVFVTWGVTYLCARHFLTAFDESMARGTAYAWAFFSACIAWLSGHWLIFYGPVAQPALLLSVIGYGMAAMYYLEHKDKLTANYRRQFVAVMAAIVLILIIFSDWSDKTI